MTCLPHYCTQKTPKRYCETWLSKVPNNIKISELTIPGTHDSCCRIKLDFCQNQTYSLPDQFNDGIRFIDIRCRHINDTFAIHHGLIFCDILFGDVLNQCRKFLEDNRNEFLIMRIQEEYEPEGCTRSFSDTFTEYLNANEDILSLTYNIPLIQEVRGKIWIIRNFDYDRGYRWGQAFIQDDYNITSPSKISDKIDKIKDHLNKAITGYKDDLYINFCSGCSSMCYPYTTAKQTNKVPMDYSGRLGIIIMDFPGEDVVDHIVNQNMIIK